MWLIDLVHSVPNVIWSGVIAATLTLGGVFASNRSNTNRLKIQLEHDSLEKQKERISTLRREVYLRSAEEMTKAFSYLGSLPKADFSDTNNTEKLQDFFASSAKLQLIAEPKTALLVNELTGAYGELTIKLIGKTIPIQDCLIEIKINDEHYNQAQNEVNRILAEMTRLNENCNATQENMAALIRSFDFQSSQAKIYADARNKAWSTQNYLHFDFCRELIPEIRVIAEMQIPVIIEIRRDLGLTVDIDLFREQLVSQLEKMKTALNSVLDALEANQQITE
ncbi:hypothetical protein H7698_02070 [Pseudomonas sp. p50]|uniref:hypothetical protein n=1 Tax=Pseudomonas sp. p50(2008) TaxID=2816832 RepID=UPI00188A64D6|nr:hypothetical protein [Pseudomonas sp. p50(2008)]MBF4554843.1 hypothetical protein [Pseudomonas sp. p50(2008)]